MKFAILNSTDPYLNLAIEEYLLKNSNDEYFLLWQNEPTVVIGRNQNAYAEINRAFTKEKGIHIVRRITGGGAVYHDLGNLNYSYIAEKQGNEIDFESFSRPVIDALVEMGLSAYLSGRNDIMIEDKKISGNAQTHFNNRVLHHGTLLFDSDLEVLSSALKVDEKKIQSKAIKSVRSRVSNIKAFLTENYTLADFVKKIKHHVLTKYSGAEFEIILNDTIKSLAKKNASDEWIFPQKDFLSSFTLAAKERFDFGTVSVYLTLKNDLITDAKIEGDFFGIREISDLEKLLCGSSLVNIADVLTKIDLSDFIFGMKTEDFLKLIKT